MRSTALVVLLLAVAAGCGKKKDDVEGGGGGGGGAVPAASTSAASDWVVVDEVAVRVQKASAQKPIVEHWETPGATVKEKERDGPELMLWVQVENRTKAKKIDYYGWSRFSGAVATDEHDNKYQISSHDGISQSLKGRGKFGALNPGESVTDVLCFELPVPAAQKLTVTLPSLVQKSKEVYRFELPASAWNR